jgi:Spy/CpxP family protein refolding chaperone
MNKQLLTVILAGAAVFLLAAAASAQAPGPGAGMGPLRVGPPPGFRQGGGMDCGPFWRNPDTVKALGLTKDQIDRLEKIELDSARQMIDLRAAQQKAWLDHAAVMKEPRLDEKKAKQTIDALMSAKKAIMYKHVEAKAAIDAVLTSEQTAKLRELAPPRCGRHGHGFGPQGDDGEDGDQDETL